jgi:TRAP-type C4-dicarboxylate transport system substrate-binding protein
MNMKKLMFLLSLVVVICLVACNAKKPSIAGDVTNDPKVTLVYAEVNPLDTVSGRTGLAFREKVEELSGGSITIVILHSGVLGSETNVLDGMIGGDDSVDLVRISAYALTNYGAEKSKLLFIPYTFVSREHFWNFANSELATEFLNEPVELNLGLRGLFYGEEGFRHFLTIKPVSGLKDFTGLKLRVSNDPVMTSMVRGIGASPTVISSGEIYSALQAGVVDGAEQPISTYKSNSFYEVAPNLLLNAHTLGVIQVIITDLAWNKLTENQREVLLEAGAYAQNYNYEISEQMNEEILQALIVEGVNVLEVHDKSEWIEACKELIISSTVNRAELYQRLQDMKDM